MAALYLVDDHVMLREAFRNVLTNRGHEVVGEADDPIAALNEIQRLRPDVVLLDLGLGNRSGFELLAEMQQRQVSSKVIVLTMMAQARHVGDAVRHGAYGYVLKGGPLEDLLLAIQQVMAGHKHFVGEVAELLTQAVMQPRSDQALLESLSSRERQVLIQVVRGQSSVEIGEAFHLSPKTVDSYRSRLMGKLGASDVTALVRFAIRSGLISADEG
ncbi:MAG TPA: response regulator transcription factor [Aquabacterium sp.]|nr:response regulator transcription factor [Aquabacterium sp.]